MIVFGDQFNLFCFKPKFLLQEVLWFFMQFHMQIYFKPLKSDVSKINVTRVLCLITGIYAKNDVSAKLALPIKVQCLLYLLLSGRLIDYDVADAPQQREVYGAANVLLVVRHQLKQFGIIVAGNL